MPFGRFVFAIAIGAPFTRAQGSTRVEAAFQKFWEGREPAEAPRDRGPTLPKDQECGPRGTSAPAIGWMR